MLPTQRCCAAWAVLRHAADVLGTPALYKSRHSPPSAPQDHRAAYGCTHHRWSPPSPSVPSSWPDQQAALHRLHCPLAWPFIAVDIGLQRHQAWLGMGGHRHGPVSTGRARRAQDQWPVRAHPWRPAVAAMRPTCNGCPHAPASPCATTPPPCWPPTPLCSMPSAEQQRQRWLSGRGGGPALKRAGSSEMEPPTDVASSRGRA
jgi:hypothetical protein